MRARVLTVIALLCAAVSAPAQDPAHANHAGRTLRVTATAQGRAPAPHHDLVPAEATTSAPAREAAPAPRAQPGEPRPDHGYQVIVHPSSPVESLSRRELADLFLKKVTTWPGGGTVYPVEPPENSAARARFTAHAIGKSPGAVKTYWNKLIFAGREVPPVEKRSDEEVVAFVHNTPGAVGYVSPGAAVAGVRVVQLKE